MKSPKSFLEVIDGGFCQFIKGDPRENPTYCRHKKKAGSAFCESHHKKCYNPNTPRVDLRNPDDAKRIRETMPRVRTL